MKPEDQHSEIRKLLTLAAAGALDVMEQRQVEEHLAGCEACRAEFRSLSRITKALQEQAAPQIPVGLAQQTRRLLELRAEGHKQRRRNQLMLGAVVLLGWALTLMNWPVLRWLDATLIARLNISSAALTIWWTTYILAAWIGTALTAAVLGKRSLQEERTL